jgi:NADPH-dependent 2,4-dienoyl-CoA reductase/sulfur reductase-like enzyme
MPKLVVVGGNAAGMSCASKAKRRAPDLEVEVLEAGRDISYSMCGVPYLVEGLVEKPRQLLVLTDDEARERGIQVRMQTKAVAFNPYTKEVVFQGPEGRDSVHYDRLCIATGSSARNPFPGGGLPGVFALRHIGDGLRLMRHLNEAGARRAVVVGGGFVGLEMAAALHTRGLETHLVQRGPRVLSTMDPDLTDGLEDWLREAGLELHLDQEAKGFAGDGRVERVLGPELEADTAVVAVGVEPNTQFAVKAGVAALQSGHLLVDDQMRTNLHDVYAAGDCVAPRHVLTGRPTPMPLSLPSNRMGRVAGDAIAASLSDIPGQAQYFPGVVGTILTRAYGLCFAQTGLTETVARQEGFDVATALIESKDMAAYMPEASDMAVKVVADAHNGKLVGIQLAGPERAALRIDAAAVAVQHGLTVRKLADTETAYSPTFSPVYDPLVVAAAACVKNLKR